MLKKNIHPMERVGRVALGIALLACFFLFPDTAYRWAFLIGLVPLVTGFMGSCPLYRVLGISTCPLK